MIVERILKARVRCTCLDTTCQDCLEMTPIEFRREGMDFPMTALTIKMGTSFAMIYLNEHALRELAADLITIADNYGN